MKRPTQLRAIEGDAHNRVSTSCSYTQFRALLETLDVARIGTSNPKRRDEILHIIETLKGNAQSEHIDFKK
jgi:hypothetical protein